MLPHSYRFWQQPALPICFGSLHRLVFVRLIVIPGNIPQLGLDWFMMAKRKKIAEKTGSDMIVTALQPHFMLDVEVISSWAIISSGPRGKLLLAFRGEVLTRTWRRCQDERG